MDRRIGNQFWKLRSKHGRDLLFKTPELFLEACEEYFTWCEDNPFRAEEVSAGKIVVVNKMRPLTLAGLCLYLGTSTQYFEQFSDNLKVKKGKRAKDFSLIISHVRQTIWNQKFSGAASGFFNANIISQEIGLITKNSNEINLKGGLHIVEPRGPDDLR